MASPLVSRAPNCISCLRGMSLCGDMASPFGRYQTRGKKFVAKAPSSVKVQLLQSIPGYGKKGSIVPITPGVMRNIWYPRKMATYVTMSQLQELGGKDIAAERDPLFGSNRERKAVERERREAKAAAAMPMEETVTQTIADSNLDNAPVAETNVHFDSPTLAEPSSPQFVTEESGSSVSESIAESASPPVELPGPLVMTPELSTSILSKLLPQSIDFFRTPTAAQAPAKPLKGVSSSLSSGAVRSAAARAQAAKTQPQEKIQKKEITGSVTKSDIEATLKAILAEDEDGSRIALSAESITLRGETADNEGIKHLGTFEVNIRLDGSAEVVKRVIRVMAQGDN